MAPYLKPEFHLYNTPISWLKITNNTNPISGEDKRKFDLTKFKSPAESPIEAFVGMMGELSKLNHTHPLWWATDIASRNRVNALTVTEADNWITISQIMAFVKKNGLNIIITPNTPSLLARATYILAISLDIQANYKPTPSLHTRLKQLKKLSKEALRSANWILKTKRLYGTHKPTKTPTDLIRSFTYQTAFINDDIYRDPFFGSLSDHLKDLGRNPVTIIQGFSDRLQCYSLISPKQKAKIIPFEIFQMILDPFFQLARIFFTAIFKPLKCPKNLYLDQNQLSDTTKYLAEINWAPLAQAALEQALWTIQLPQLMAEAAGKRIAASFNIRSFVTTCEANPWEIMLTKGLRSNPTHFTILGYQHSVVPPAALGMFTSKEEQELRPAPDRILTTGSVPANILERYGEGNRGRVYPACALRYEYLFRNNLETPRQGSVKTVLVALEGLLEVSDMVAYLIREAPLNPDMTFVVRSHPVLPLDEILNHLGYEEALPSNIRTNAKSPVAQDLADCDVVFYWSTTVALEAILYGKPLIHFSKGGVFNYDPLAELDKFKLCTDVGVPIKNSINIINSWSQKTYEREKTTAQRYVREYLHPVSEEAMSPFFTEKI
ncbi:hypothetical protein [Kiloniella antarctica]|uniref:Capsule polysaccharide biosynthesis protein n=1 Tax=Kiloniella antarctica TaxID=1550907 RepID=A0ABW5BPR5_9PROT